MLLRLARDMHDMSSPAAGWQIVRSIACVTWPSPLKW